MDTILKTTVDEDQHSKLVEKYRKAKLANENQHNVIFLLYDKLIE